MGPHFVTSIGLPCIQIFGLLSMVPSNEIALSTFGGAALKNRLKLSPVFKSCTMRHVVSTPGSTHPLPCTSDLESAACERELEYPITQAQILKRRLSKSLNCFHIGPLS